MRWLIAILFFWFNLISFSQTKNKNIHVSKQTKEIVQKMQMDNQVLGNELDFGAIEPQQHALFGELRSVATEKELIKLTDHKNPSVRCYAFWALCDIYKVDILPILIKHIHDTAKVYVQFGCIGNLWSVGDFFIHHATSDSTHPSILDSTQLATLDSFLLVIPNKLRSRFIAIQRIVPDNELYNLLKSMVTKEHNGEALVALAKFQKEEDILIIQQFLREGKYQNLDNAIKYKAICEFPHPDFFPLLKRDLTLPRNHVFIDSEYRELYHAIASYRNIEARELLKYAYKQIKDSNLGIDCVDFLFSAMEKYYDPVYNNLFWELWIVENKINFTVFRYLTESDSAKATVQAAETINNNFSEFIKSQSLFTEMLELVFSRDSAIALDIISSKIEVANNYQFRILNPILIDLQHSTLINPLFERLEYEYDPTIYLQIVQVLISYKDVNINQRILETQKTNFNLTRDSGGKKLDELLTENNIR
ncbi:MAG: hypothetical protein GC181_11380 [Bacteroidetes bacterium]|nr:hypothetical protein [Bacteroidota bacterium]